MHVYHVLLSIHANISISLVLRSVLTLCVCVCVCVCVCLTVVHHLGLHNGCKQKKPFNPILGETYQATYPDGTNIFLEQISHHPPVSMYELEGPGKAWKLRGYNEYKVN